MFVIFVLYLVRFYVLVRVRDFVHSLLCDIPRTWFTLFKLIGVLDFCFGTCVVKHIEFYSGKLNFLSHALISVAFGLKTQVEDEQF